MPISFRWLHGPIALLAMSTAWAEARTWTDKSGQYKVEADFVAIEDQVVVLRKPSGQTLRVPLEKLSDADQSYARQAASTITTRSDSRPSTRPSSVTSVEQFEHSIAHERSARAIARCYAELFAQDREAANDTHFQERKSHWEQLASSDAVRLGLDTWCAKAEAQERIDEVDRRLVAAARLVEVGNEDVIRQTLQEASRAAPWSIEPDGRLGLLCALIFQDAEGAEAAFDNCVKRRRSLTAPRGVDRLNLAASHNNLAIICVRLRKWREAMRNWRSACELIPNSPEFAHNVGKFSRLTNSHSHLRMPSEVAREAAEVYARIAVNAQSAPLNAHKGWLFVRFTAEPTVDEMLGLAPIIQPTPSQPTPSQPLAGSTPAPPSGTAPTNGRPSPPLLITPRVQEIRDEMTLSGGGTGFVVAPGVVMTNRHVVEDAHALLARQADTKREWEARVVAVSAKEDLALLTVAGLDMPPLPLAPVLPRLATDITVVGFPLFFDLGNDMKVSRGVVSGLPNSEGLHYLLYDAVTNGGNSGGPVLDQSGVVVAVHAIGIQPEVRSSRMAGGVPSDRALAFLRERVTDGLPSPPQGNPSLPWADVVAVAGKSTVHLLCYRRASSVDFVARLAKNRPVPSLPMGPNLPGALPPGVPVKGQSPANASAAGSPNLLEDPWCTSCYGSGKMPCTQRGCSKGRLQRQVVDVLGVSTGGRPITRTRTVYERCTTCEGADKVPCLGCRGSRMDG